MNKQVADFLDSEKLCSLTIIVNDGTPHASTMHFSYVAEPEIKFYFSTDKNTRKAEKIRTGGSAPAAIVIGFSESHWTTFQASGDIAVVSDKQKEEIVKKHHYDKNSTSARYADDPSTVMLEFTPKWWKYSNLAARPAEIFEG